MGNRPCHILWCAIRQRWILRPCADRQKRCIDWQSQRGKYWRQLLRRKQGTERPTSQKTWRHALMCMLDEVTRRVWRGLGVDSTEYGLDQSKPCGSNIATEQQRRSLSTAVRQPEGFQTNSRTCPLKKDAEGDL